MPQLVVAGTQVQFYISGSGFTPVTAVWLNGQPTGDWELQADNDLRVTPSGQPAGTDMTIQLRYDGGASGTPITEDTTVHWVAQPVVTSVSPATGSTAGGQSVTISGNGFTWVDSVNFGNVAATSFDVDSDSQITAVVPTQSAGEVDVRVGFGAVHFGAQIDPWYSDVSAQAKYTYSEVPTISNVAPATGSVDGGDTVVIQGSGLADASSVTFGGTPVTSIDANTDSEITVTTPAHAAGGVAVVVTTGNGSSVPGQDPEYTYIPNVAPAMDLQPQPTTVTAGAQASFTATATGTPTPTIRWQTHDGTNWVDISGATASPYSFATQKTDDGRQFRAVFTNVVSSVTSNAVVLTVNSPPEVTDQPDTQTKTAGEAVTFTAAATGKPTPTVQWQVKVGAGNWTDIPSETDTSYTFTTAAGDDGNQYRAVFSNGIGSPEPTDAATLTVNTAPTVTTDPQTQTKVAGTQVTFTAAATGKPTPTVQWQVKVGAGNWTDIPSETDTSYVFTTATGDNGKQYRAVFTNGIGSPAATTAATLTVTSAPVVTTQPQGQSVTAGASASFTAAATGNPTPTVQWQVKVGAGNWTDIPSAAAGTYTFTAVAGDNGNQYRAVFSNGIGDDPVATEAVTLTVNTAPTVTTHPQSQTKNAGQQVTFTAAADGNPTPAVQWQVKVGTGNWTDISGAVGSPYTFTTAAADNARQYRAVFTNSVTAVASDPATLTVDTAPTVTTQPQTTTVTVGASVSLTAAAGGQPTPTVQWQVKVGTGSWIDIDGATSATYTFTAAIDDDGKQYRAVFTNGVGSAPTDAATLTVNPEPTPPDAPTGVNAVAGTSSIAVSWTASATNGAPVTGYTAYARPGPATCHTDGATNCVLGATANTPYTVVVVANSDLGDSDESEPSTTVTATAPEPPAEPPPTTLRLTTDQGAISEASPGEQITFIGTGFAPHSTAVITIYSDPIVLGTAVTNGAGNFTKLVTIPRGLQIGDHTVVAQGVAPDGGMRAMSLAITVAPRGSGLAVTGPAVVAALITGLSLTLAGAALVGGSRVRRRHGAT